MALLRLHWYPIQGLLRYLEIAESKKSLKVATHNICICKLERWRAIVTVVIMHGLVLLRNTVYVCWFVNCFDILKCITVESFLQSKSKYQILMDYVLP